MAGYILPVFGHADATTKDLNAIVTLPSVLNEKGQVDITKLFFEIARKHGIRPIEPGVTSIWSGDKDYWREFTFPWGETSAFMVFHFENSDETTRIIMDLGLPPCDSQFFHLTGLQTEGGRTTISYIDDRELSWICREEGRAGYLTVASLKNPKNASLSGMGFHSQEMEYLEGVVNSLLELGFPKSDIVIQKTICIPSEP